MNKKKLIRNWHRRRISSKHIAIVLTSLFLISSNLALATSGTTYFGLDNNKWGNPSATQSINWNTYQSKVLIYWNNPGYGWNFPEIYTGTKRNYVSTNWNVFPSLQSSIKSMTATIGWKFTQPPTRNTWWNFAFDLYWSTKTGPYSCQDGSKYNFMIWIQVPNGKSFANAGNAITSYTDRFGNTWDYYLRPTGCGGTPWGVWVLTGGPYLSGSDITNPVTNKQYNIQIDILGLTNAIPNKPISGSWIFPGLELGFENSGSLGQTTASVEVNSLQYNVNGQTVNFR